MKTLLLGSTGLLGQAMVAELDHRKWPVVTAARSGAQLALDISDLGALDRALTAEAPDLVINCAAMASIPDCEANPEQAWAINVQPLTVLSEWANQTGGKLVHISTDHFFTEGGARPHREDEERTPINAYAVTKMAAEEIALPGALVLRTSIVGIRGWREPTFAEWAIDAAERNLPITLFSDAYTSAIDTRTFARAALDLVERGWSGLLNCAASEVYTKEAFIRAIAAALGRSLDRATVGSAKTLVPPRPTSLGLDVSHAEAILGYRLPNLAEVVEAVLEQYMERQSA